MRKNCTQSRFPQIVPAIVAGVLLTALAVVLYLGPRAPQPKSVKAARARSSNVGRSGNSPSSVSSMRTQASHLDDRIATSRAEVAELESTVARSSKKIESLLAERDRLLNWMPSGERIVREAGEEAARASMRVNAFQIQWPGGNEAGRNAKNDAVAQLRRVEERRHSANAKLIASRQRLGSIASELAEYRQLLAEQRNQAAAAQGRQRRLVGDRQKLNSQGAATEAQIAQAALRRSQTAVSEGRKAGKPSATVVKPSPGGFAYAPVGPQTGGGLSHLPKAVRTLILAEAAGVDTGLDLGLNDTTEPPFIAPLGDVRTVSPIQDGVSFHRDGLGRTTRHGNQTLVERVNGPAAIYTREGDWESVQWSNGVHGYRHYDDLRGVQKFDMRNPSNGVRTIGEEPYVGNDYGQGWSQLMAW